jgi:hypothetical protein
MSNVKNSAVLHGYVGDMAWYDVSGYNPVSFKRAWHHTTRMSAASTAAATTPSFIVSPVRPSKSPALLGFLLVHDNLARVSSSASSGCATRR